MGDPLCLANPSQKRNRIPLVRFNPVSPYSNPNTGISTNITTEQLNMRRKTEILKYESNRMPNQTNNFTKKQKWSRLVTQPSRDKPQTDVVNPDNCFTNIPVSSTASGVPGPSIMLYEDPNIPLYNYIVTRTYAYNVPNENAYWETTVNTNVGLYSGIAGSVFSLNILPSINRPQYTFGMYIPLGLRVEGWNESGTNTVDISIITASLFVYCNGKNITTQLSGRPTLTKTSNQRLTVRVDTPKSKFNATQVVGSVGFSGIPLFTSNIYTFDFQLVLDLNIKINDTEVSNNPSNLNESLDAYAYANMTNVNPNTAFNCTIINPSTSIPLITPELFT